MIVTESYELDADNNQVTVNGETFAVSDYVFDLLLSLSEQRDILLQENERMQGSIDKYFFRNRLN